MIYAQYRLGAELISSMPPQIRRTIGRFRQLYDIGLHGPELLCYCNQGQKYLRQTGRVFFDRVCRTVRMDPSEGALAYLYGVLVHYAICSVTDPMLRQQSEELSVPIGQIRTEFDRYLLELDEKKLPVRYDRSLHLKLTPGECQTVAMFYPGIRPRMVSYCVKRLAMVMEISAKAESSGRKAAQKLLSLTADADRIMMPRADRRLKTTNALLLQGYGQAKREYPDLLDQIQIRLQRKVWLGDAFADPFART